MLCLHVNRNTFEFPDKKRERERLIRLSLQKGECIQQHIYYY